MAFSTRFVMIRVILTSSTSATTGRTLSNTTSTSFFRAMGRSLFKISSVRSLMFNDTIFRSCTFLSIFTSANRSVMIWFSLSISEAMSSMNSRYSSAGTFSCASRESDNTLMDVMGVFNSWDTFATNSCRESSNAFIRFNSWLNASTICTVST